MEAGGSNGSGRPRKAEYEVEGSVLKVNGRLTSGEEEELRSRGREVASSGKDVTLDLAGVSYICSSCLGAVLILHEELGKEGRNLRVRLPQSLLYVYDLMGIRNIVQTEIVDL